jgi:hypothetical protein
MGVVYIGGIINWCVISAEVIGMVGGKGGEGEEDK